MRTVKHQLQQYQKWVLQHPELARNIENVLYLFPQLAPTAWGQPSTISELTYANVGLIRMAHDIILSRKDTQKADFKDKVLYSLQLPLTVLAHVQVVVEILAQKGGRSSKWNSILGIEIAKAMLKLMILAQNQGRMLCMGGQLVCKSSNPSMSTSKRGKTIFSMENAVGDMVLKDPMGYLGETCHVLRPVLYAALKRKYAETSWMPVGASLVVECLSLASTIAATKKKSIDPVTSDEIARRKLCLLFYVLRNPIFNQTTRPLAEKLCEMSSEMPLLGRMMEFAVHHGLFYYQQFHFYTSASS